MGSIPGGQEDPLEEGMETHSSILAWRIPQTEEPGGLQSIGSQSLTCLKRLNTHTAHHEKNTSFQLSISAHCLERVWLDVSSTLPFLAFPAGLM